MPVVIITKLLSFDDVNLADVSLKFITALAMMLGKCALLLALVGLVAAGTRSTRSIDLSAAHQLISDTRLPGEIVPNNYTIDLRPNMEESKFTGKIKIVMTWQEPTNQITIHCHNDLEVAENTIRLSQIGVDRT